MIFNLYDEDTQAIDTSAYDSIVTTLQAVSTNFIAKIYSGADYIKSVIDKNSKITMNELCTMLKNIPAFYSQLSINEVNIIVISITENGTSNDVLFVYNDDDIDIINLINIINKKYLATYHKMITISSDDRQKLIKKTLQNDMKKLSDICSKLDTENKYKAWQPRAVVKNIDAMTKDAEYSDDDAYVQINAVVNSDGTSSNIVSSKSQFAVYNDYMNNLDGIIQIVMDNHDMFIGMAIGPDKNKQLILNDLYPHK